MSALAARSPRSRKSLGHSLGDRDLNTERDDAQPEMTEKGKGKVRMRANKSIGAEDPSTLTSPSKITFSVGRKELSPRSQARRKAVPRKSILKSFSAPHLDQQAELASYNVEQDTVNFDRENVTVQAQITEVTQVDRRTSVHVGGGDNHTFAYGSLRQSQSMGGGGRPSMGGRRVSFAPSAHVRMFEPSTQRNAGSAAPNTAAPAPRTNIFAQNPVVTIIPGPRPSASSHSRRSSIHDLSGITGPADPAAQGGGEESMEIEDETDSEAFDSEDDAAEVNQSAYLAPSTAEHHDFAREDDDEQPMDMTENFGGGIISQEQDEGDETFNSSEANSSTRTNESQGMDFTVAIGGILPNAPPTNARRGRASLGYSNFGPDGNGQPALLPGHGDDDEEMEMDETGVFGGIIQPDDSLSSTDDTIDAGHTREPTVTYSVNDLRAAAAKEQSMVDMDMTTARGGLLPNTSFGGAGVPKSPKVSSITRPMSGTPSFARPTASSASKSRSRSPEKRNIFGPSPSPFKSSTPRKTGMQTAAEVAKRLSFGSTTSSVAGSAKKRARPSTAEEEDEDIENSAPEATASPAKRQRLSNPLGDSVFGRPSLPTSTPRETPPTPARQPRHSVAAPQATPSKSPAKMASTTPSRSPAIRRAMGVPVTPFEEERPEDWEPETIGLGAFLEMAGVQFVDTPAGVNRRRSSVAKSRLGQSALGRDRDFAPYDYTDAKVHSIFLNMYNWATGRIKSDITSGQSDLASTESIYSQNNPPVIKEYLAANDDDKQLFELTFKAFKTNTQLKARAKWYDWKHGILENIRPDVEEVYNEVKQDQERLDEMNDQADAFLPQLRERAILLQQELARERAVVAEIEECDQEDLMSWKEAIAEQQAQVDSKASEAKEKTGRLEELKTQLASLSAIKAGHETAISLAKSKCDEYTKSDVTKLKREYESLQTLHQWRIDLFRSDRFELVYADEIRLSFDCSAFVPNIASREVALVSLPAAEHPVTEGLFELLKLNMKIKSKSSLSQLVQRVGSIWASAQRLRREMALLALRHPVSYTFNAPSQTLTATSTMMLDAIRSKIKVDFHFTPESLVGFPGSLADTQTAVQVVYGQADAGSIKAKADEFMAHFNDAGYLGGFATTCLGISEEFDL